MGSPEIFARLTDEESRPDGATIDAMDNYWSAGVSAGCLNIFSFAGLLTKKMTLPCRSPTMCTLRGATGDVLYVTYLI